MQQVALDVAGGSTGGAARFRVELLRYLKRFPRQDVSVIGIERRLNLAWLAVREAAAPRSGRRIALNNVGFLLPGGERWTVLRNALHFMTDAEAAELEPGLRTMAARQAAIVHRAARRSDVLIAPSTAMAERIADALPEVTGRLTVRMHPVSAVPFPAQPGQLILCPVIFERYKHMPERLAEWLDAISDGLDHRVRMVVTAAPAQVPPEMAANPRLKFTGHLNHAGLYHFWARSRAVYFPPGLEAFGYPLAEARASGRPVIARDTPQNREIAGPALCGYSVGDPDSLREATETALTMALAPDPAPFSPDAYFSWMLGKDG